MEEGKMTFLFSKGRYHNRTYGIYLDYGIGLCNNILWIGFIWIRDHGEVPRDQIQSQIKDQQVWNKFLRRLEKVLTGNNLTKLGSNFLGVTNLPPLQESRPRDSRVL